MKTTVYITGASGFLGQYLCREWRKEFDQVIGVSRTGPFMRWEQFHALPRVAEGQQVFVVHTAGAAHIPAERLTAEDNRNLEEGIVRLAARVAEKASQMGARRLVYLSTAKVNGPQNENAACVSEEEYPAAGDLDPYTRSKRAAEKILTRIALQTGLAIVSIRPPLVYGPGVKANFLSLMKAVDRRIPLPLGCIDNRRSLIYIGNLASALLAALRSPQAANRAYLVSDPRVWSTPALIRDIASAAQRPALLIPVPKNVLKLAGRCLGKTPQMQRLTESFAVDSSRIREELGW